MLGGEVRDVLGYYRAALRPGGSGNVGIVGRPESDFGHVDCIKAVPLAQQLGCGCREHLIDQEGGHASSAARCAVVMRLRSAIARCRSILAVTSPGCSAA